jgi:CAAX protease family protein
MVWTYERIGSLFVAMLMHVSVTASPLVLEPSAISGVDLPVCRFVSAVAWWVVVATVAVASGPLLSRQPLRAEAA